MEILVGDIMRIDDLLIEISNVFEAEDKKNKKDDKYRHIGWGKYVEKKDYNEKEKKAKEGAQVYRKEGKRYVPIDKGEDQEQEEQPQEQPQKQPEGGETVTGVPEKTAKASKEVTKKAEELNKTIGVDPDLASTALQWLESDDDEQVGRFFYTKDEIVKRGFKSEIDDYETLLKNPEEWIRDDVEWSAGISYTEDGVVIEPKMDSALPEVFDDAIRNVNNVPDLPDDIRTKFVDNLTNYARTKSKIQALRGFASFYKQMMYAYDNNKNSEEYKKAKASYERAVDASLDEMGKFQEEQMKLMKFANYINKNTEYDQENNKSKWSGEGAESKESEINKLENMMKEIEKTLKNIRGGTQELSNLSNDEIKDRFKYIRGKKVFDKKTNRVYWIDEKNGLLYSAPPDSPSDKSLVMNRGSTADAYVRVMKELKK